MKCYYTNITTGNTSTLDSHLKPGYLFLTLEYKQTSITPIFQSIEGGMYILWPKQYPSIIFQFRKNELVMGEFGAKSTPYKPEEVSVSVMVD